MDRISSTYCQSALNANHSGTFNGSDFNAKEKDCESGFHYYGARYYDSEVLTGWLSVDPMADKYPSISPYAYCAWNPVKLVDPDGNEIGDYYSLTGNYLGWDGHFDNKVHIIGDKTSLKKDPNGYVDQSKVMPLVSTTYETLSATVGVFNRTKNNGGGKEESTAVIAERFSIQGNTGYTGADGNPYCDFPTLTEEQQLLDITSIHSHPFIAVKQNGYYPATPSDDDKALFGLCNMNIIVGYTSTPTERGIYPYSTDNIGAAFFDSASSLTTTMSMHSIGKIVNNRQDAMIDHFKQIANRL